METPQGWAQGGLLTPQPADTRPRTPVPGSGAVGAGKAIVVAFQRALLLCASSWGLISYVGAGRAPGRGRWGQ